MTTPAPSKPPVPPQKAANQDPPRPAAAPIAVPPPAPAARMRRRHHGVALSFALMVLLPVLLSAWYLWTRASDQYASYAGFSVRTEEASSAMDLLGGLGALSGSSSSDTDILYKFIQSQGLVATIDARLDLRALWAKADPGRDPVFAYHGPGTIEDLLDYWTRMVKVYNDSGTGLIDLEVRAFTPQDATLIAEAVYAESSAMINRLSAIAREDAIHYSREELAGAVARLKAARAAMTAFRNRTQIVDPQADIQGQVGLLSSLQAQLAETLIELDILSQTTHEGDPRVTQAERKVAVIETRMEAERRKLGIGGEGDEAVAFATLVGEYESLYVDQQFAEQSYTVALAAFDAAQAEARRQSRYLAAHIAPTRAEQAEYPQRGVLLFLIGLFLVLIWAILTLVAYSLKDRR
ncbi:capsule biosynthesis protein [Shimia sp.]|uniref:capsule biosynthesis protein n=1 Tax=Shimia sp. TaxID=1954381 RepID=UPI003566480D